MTDKNSSNNKKVKANVGIGMTVLHYRKGKMKFGFAIATEDFYSEQLLYIELSLFKWRIQIGYVGNEE